ncbi:MAG: M81 family metallopeptidase [Chloroflexi bacterium]|nr:M81 family metallopeptidase [Chloroflexota bacterium]
MRIAIGGIMHESNTFSPVPTRLADFSVQRGGEIVMWWAKAHHEVGGFLEGAAQFGFEPVPLLMASATPGGTVSAEAFEALAAEMVALLRGVDRVDGLLLALHGAMVSENYSDGDGEILRRVRDVMGSELPIVVTHDLHANVSEQLVRNCTALVVYKTYPHLDHRERGIQVAKIVARSARGEVTPVQAMVKPPMMINIVRQYTSAEPIEQIMDAVRDVENTVGVLAASLAEGYQYADVEEMGPSFVVVTDGDLKLATTRQVAWAQMLWTSAKSWHSISQMPLALLSLPGNQRERRWYWWTWAITSAADRQATALSFCKNCWRSMRKHGS